MVEDARAVYGPAEQVKRSRAVTLVEIVIVDRCGNERLLESHHSSDVKDRNPLKLVYGTKELASSNISV